MNQDFSVSEIKHLRNCIKSANRDIMNAYENGEGVDLFCFNCNLEFTSFLLRNFIKLKGFKEL